MKPEPVRDTRLHDRPVLRRCGGEYRLTAFVPTPARITVAEQLFYLPLNSNSRLILVIATLVFAAVWLTIIPPPTNLPFNWQLFVAGAAAFMVLWQIERAFGFKLTARLFYRRLSFSFAKDTVVVNRWPLKKRISRKGRVAFIYVPIEAASTPIFRNSYCIFCVLSDIRKIKIMEVYGLRSAEHIVANCNVALTLAFPKIEA